MISKKRIVLVTMLLITIGLLVVGCSNTMDEVYNDNGKIANEGDSFSLDDSDEIIELGVYRGKFKLSGSGTVWTYESTSDFDMIVPYTLLVKSGKAKIVLISPDNTVVTLVENTSEASVIGSAQVTVPIKKGNNRIKLVGYKKADIEVELNIDRGTLKDISFK